MDEALTRSFDNLAIDTVVSQLKQIRLEWPEWIRIVATSRPDEQTREDLGALSGAVIEVCRKENLEDVKEFVKSRLQSSGTVEPVQSTKRRLSFAKRRTS